MTRDLWTTVIRGKQPSLADFLGISLEHSRACLVRTLRHDPEIQNGCLDDVIW